MGSLHGSLLLLLLACTTVQSSMPPPAPSAQATPPLDADEDYPVRWPSGAETPFNHEAYPVTWRYDDKEPDDDRAATGGHGGFHAKPGMLFLRKSLYPGALLPRGTTLGLKSQPKQFVSKREAESFPFSSTELERILRTFSIRPGSERADRVAYTLRTCESGACATSQEAELDLVARLLAPGSRRVVTAVHGAEEPAQYTVASISPIPGGDAVLACHSMEYPYVVRYCHRPTQVEALSVQLTGVGGGATAAAAVVCHKNTTTWYSSIFRLLHAPRGEEICHYMPQNYVLWVKM